MDTQNRPVSSDEEEIYVLDYLIVIAKHKKLILLVTLMAILVAAAVSMILPEVYTAETRLLPSQENTASMNDRLLGTLYDIGIPAPMLPGDGLGELYAGLLETRRVLDGIIEKFDLLQAYGLESVAETREELAKAVTAESRDDGLMVVSVEDTDPERAANMANAFVEELQGLLKGLAITKASRKRLFLEEQLFNAKEALTGAEEEMLGFQRRTGALKIDNQAEAVIQAIANLKALVAEKEVELRVMSSYSTPSNPDMAKIREELDGLRAELKKLEQGQGSPGLDPLMPVEKMSTVGAEYLRRLRDLKFHESLYDLLLKQYETARLDEANEAIVIQVIDTAIPPEKRARPKKIFMIFAGAAAGFFIAVVLAFFADYKERALSNPEARERLERFKKYFSFGG